MQSDFDKLHAKYPHVYAILRFDLDRSGEYAATVVKVLTDKLPAEKEAARLNGVNQGKSCAYRVQKTRFVENLEM